MFVAGVGIIVSLLVLSSANATGASSSTASVTPGTPARNQGTGMLTVAPEQATIVLYGDSLAWEARQHFQHALTAAGLADVRTSTYGGTAICDWLDTMRADAIALHPTAVVVEFSGNALTGCMTDSASGQSIAASPIAYHAKYRDDASEVLRIFAATNTRVYFAGAPTTRLAEQTNDPNAGRLNRLYARLAGGSVNGRYIDAGAAVLDRGRWTETLPCLSSEPCTGGVDTRGQAVNIVRAPDGGHFCPDAPDANRGVTDDCLGWSSGAYRYGTAMAIPIIRDLRLG